MKDEEMGNNIWEIKRNEFNHDWLKNRYLNSLDALIERLKSNTNLERVIEYIKMDYTQWKSKREDLDWLIENIGEFMSPSAMIEKTKLSRLQNEYLNQLKDISKYLWLNKITIKTRIENIKKLKCEADMLYNIIEKEIEKNDELSFNRLENSKNKFIEYREVLVQLSKSISELPHDPAII